MKFPHVDDLSMSVLLLLAVPVLPIRLQQHTSTQASISSSEPSCACMLSGQLETSRLLSCMNQAVLITGMHLDFASETHTASSACN